MTPIQPSLDNPDPRCAICPAAAVYDREGVYLCALCADVVDGRRVATRTLVPLLASHEVSLWGWITAVAALLLFSSWLFLSLTDWMVTAP